MRTKVLLGSAFLVLTILVLAEPARADNCSSLGDCYRTLQAAVAATVGLAVFASIVSFGLDLIPGVGQVKGLIEAITGEDLITGQELAWYERVLGVVPVGGALLGGAFAIGRAAGRAGDLVDVVGDVGRAIDRVDDIGDVGRAADRAGDFGDTKKLIPNTPEHKAARWDAYQARGGKWNYDRWSKQYDTNMQNVSRGLAREVEYRTAMGGQNRILDTPLGNRQIDVYIPDKAYAGQIKTGKQYLTKENVWAIERDAYLIQKENLEVEWILEKGGSEPLLKALRDAGINYHIGSKLP